MPTEHRKTPSRRAFVPPGWFIVLTVVVAISGAGWLGWLVVDSKDEGSASAGPTVSTPPPTPTRTTAPPSKATPTPTKTPTKTKAPAPEIKRDAPVAVLNNTRVSGLAGAFAAKVRTAGWTVGNIGNWRGSVPNNTVYYPEGLQDEAKLLGKDVGIVRVLPSVAPMQVDRLTLILSGPQQ